MLNEYKKFVKDNPQGYWFKAKLYGWGWTPVKWQGWLVIFIFVILVTLNAFRLEINSRTSEVAVFTYLPETALLCIGLIMICYLKGEKPSWRWGKRDK